MTDFTVDTPPSLQLITVSVPGAGREWSFTIPADQVYLIHSVHFHFVAVGGLQNRAISLQISDGSNNFIELPIDSAVPAGSTVHYVWATGIDYKVDTNTDISTAPLPEHLCLPAGYILATLTDNILGGDQFSNIFLFISPFILPVDRG